LLDYRQYKIMPAAIKFGRYEKRCLQENTKVRNAGHLRNKPK